MFTKDGIIFLISHLVMGGFFLTVNSWFADKAAETYAKQLMLTQKANQLAKIAADEARDCRLKPEDKTFY